MHFRSDGVGLLWIIAERTRACSFLENELFESFHFPHREHLSLQFNCQEFGKIDDGLIVLLRQTEALKSITKSASYRI